MKVLFFICFCLVLPLTGRQLDNNGALHPLSLNGLQNTQGITENRHEPTPKTGSKTDEHQLITGKPATQGTNDQQGIASLFGYFLEPEFAGILLLVAIVGLSGMKHAD